MIKTLIIALAILLYLLIGYRLFQKAIYALGGSMEYINKIASEDPKIDPLIVYFWAGFLVMMFWPYFLFKTAIDGRE